MTYPPPQQPPVMPGYQPPPPGDWKPPTAKKRGPLPWLVGALVVAVLLVGALVAVFVRNGGLSGAEAKPAAASGPASVVKAASEYDGAQRLAGALNRAGIPCLNFESVDNPINAIDLGNCYVGTEEIVVAIHASHEEAVGDPADKAQILKGVSDVNEVVGGNWTLSCDSVDLCKRIEREFGGSYVHVPA